MKTLVAFVLFASFALGQAPPEHAVRVYAHHDDNPWNTYDALGSGTLVRPDYVVTAHHVVAKVRQGEFARYNIDIRFKDNSRVKGYVLAFDEEHDIALIKIEKTDMKPATFGEEIGKGFAQTQGYGSDFEFAKIFGEVGTRQRRIKVKADGDEWVVHTKDKNGPFRAIELTARYGDSGCGVFQQNKFVGVVLSTNLIECRTIVAPIKHVKDAFKSYLNPEPPKK